MSFTAYFQQSAAQGFSKTCASGYARLSDNFCVAIASPSITTFNGAADGVSRNQVLDSLIFLPNLKPAQDANAVLILLDCKICAAGVAGTHEFNAAVYSDHAGTIITTNIAFTCYEPSGMVAGTWIGGGETTVLALVTGPNLEITTSFFDSGNGAGSEVQGAYVVGYWD